MKRQGKLIVIDGTDGTGKGTQTELLVARLKKERERVLLVDFPNYGSPSAYFVEAYLNGKFGSAQDVGPYRASTFFALDRYATKPILEKALKRGSIVIANRYVSANMGHQGAMLTDKRERRALIAWIDDLEFGVFRLPRPDLTIILHIPAHIAQTLVDRKKTRKYLKGKKRDILESDLGHLVAAEQTYRDIAAVLQNTELLECMDDRRLMTIEEVHERIWSIVVKKIL